MLGRAIGRGLANEVVVPVITPVDHRHVGVAPVDHHHRRDGRTRVERGVDVHLERGRRSTAIAGIGGDHADGVAVVDSIGDRIGAEPTEDHGVGGTDAGTCEHRHGQFGDHRHVDRDAVAPLHPEVPERVRESGDVVAQLGVGDRAGVTGLPFPVQRDPVAETGLDVTVEAVVTDVELAADEPLRVGEVPLEGRVEVLEPGHELAGLTGPERLVVGVGLVVERPVPGIGRYSELRARGEHPILVVVVLDRRLTHASPPRSRRFHAGAEVSASGLVKRWGAGPSVAQDEVGGEPDDQERSGDPEPGRPKGRQGAPECRAQDHETHVHDE